MRILIAEDDLVSRKFMQKVLCRYGQCSFALDGVETVESFMEALQEGKPFDLICMDIMLPKLDGLKALKIIRDQEKEKGVGEAERTKVIMTTALNDKKTVDNSYNAGCEAYLWKPIEVETLLATVNKLGFKELTQES